MKENTSKTVDKGSRHQVSLLLHDIRSIHNVGSMFRTADAFGVEKIYISGYTPGPVDRFGRKRQDLAKVALTAEESVPWEQVSEPIELVKKLKSEGYVIVALEQAPTAIDYREVKDKVAGKDGAKSGSSKNILIILGNEVEGVSSPLLELSDIIAEIPMKGQKESLNVSVAGGIFLFSFLD